MTLTGVPTHAPGPVGTVEPELQSRTVPTWVTIVAFGLAAVFLAGAIVQFGQRRDAISSRDAALAQVVMLTDQIHALEALVAKETTRIAGLTDKVFSCQVVGLAASYFNAYDAWPEPYVGSSRIRTTQACYGTAVPVMPWPAP